MKRPVVLAPFGALMLLASCGTSNPGGPNDCINPDTCPANVSCTPGMVRCGPGGAVQRCKEDGTSWDTQAHCAGNQSCRAGQCTPAGCTGMTSVCTEDGRMQTCLPQVGQYSDPVGCPVGSVCVGTGCIPQVCSPNQRFCLDGQSVAQCNRLGDNSSVIERCTGNSSCAAGGCLDACQAADINKSFAGCQFYSIDMDNFEFDDPQENDIAVANQSTFTAHVKLEVRQGATNWAVLCQADVPSQQTHVFALNASCVNSPINPTPPFDRHFEDSGLVNALAYRVTSNAPIVAYQYNSDDLNRGAASSGASVLLPKATLGKKYYVLTWPQPDPASSFNLQGSMDIARSELDIVGTADGTNVMVRASTRIIAGSGVPMMMPGQQQSFTLNEGDVLQLESLMTGDDLSGTYIEASKPVAVFAGAECAVNVDPRGSPGGGYCDHIEEQLLPLIAWGKNYVAPRVVAQANSDGCDFMGPPETACPPSRWRVIASVDNTHVTMTPPTGVTLTPPGPFMLSAGQLQEVLARGSSPSAAGDFLITADQPILVMQLSGGEATMTTAVPVEQYLPSYLFEVTDYFCSNLTVVRKRGSSVQLDGAPIADSLFNPAGGEYEVARLPLNMAMCGASSSGAVTPHTVRAQAGPEGRSSPAGIVVSGMDSNCSYSYVGGLNVNVINPVE